MKKLAALVIIMIIFLSYCGKKETVKLELPEIFSDNMVLQRNFAVSFWGTGNRGEKILINTDWGEQNTTTVDSKGNWSLRINTPDAGGPYRIDIISEQDTISYENVMIGEVWLCSGQSNMEMPLKGWPPTDTILHAEQEIENSNFPDIRLFTVKRNISPKPVYDCTGKWSVCNPQTIADFSATAYFFGRRLHKKLGIPIGLIHSSWGGTPAESWTPAEELRNMDDFRKTIANLDKAAPQIKALNNWLEGLKKIEMSKREEDGQWKNLDFNDKKLSEIEYVDTAWSTMKLPTKWEETEVGKFDGAIWFRKAVDMEGEGKNYVLEMGPIDDMDQTYFNGKKVGGVEEAGFWNKDRVYEIPGKLVQDGKNIIAVRVVDNAGGGGIYGKPEQMKIYPEDKPADSISLAGEWRYFPVAEFHNDNFYIYGKGAKSYQNRPELDVELNSHTPTVLFNGMINPLIPYSIRGAIWYQGESNVGRAKQYKRLFPLMIKSWRKDWKQGAFPFYYVQIAPYKYGDDAKSQRLREAQLQTLSLENTGMVVTTDIGNPDNIHPANKQEVGTRLARWALAKDYGFSDIVYSGPIYKSMKIEDNKIRIFFDFVDGGLTSFGEELTRFKIADTKQEFVPAQAKIDGNSVVVWSDNIDKPVAVRFGWSNTPEPNLFNEAGLPASPFRTDNW